MQDEDPTTEEIEHARRVRNYALLLLTQSRIDPMDEEMYILILQRMLKDLDQAGTFATLSLMALMSLGRVDPYNWDIDPEPMEVSSAVERDGKSITPGELEQNEATRGLAELSYFIGHVAANDVHAAMHTLDSVFTMKHKGADTVCSCQLFAFVSTLSVSADHALRHRH